MSDEAIGLEYVVPARGWASKDVVGEFYYSDAILALLPRLPSNGDPVQAELHIDLVPEKDNPHDRRAVSVRSHGKVLGYLAREMAAEYSLPVQRIVASGARVRAAASAHAYVNQWKGEPQINVRVALPEPEMMIPVNDGYPSNTAVLPYGRSYQVTKEEDHFEHLFNYVPSSGTGMVILTMHRNESTLKNGSIRETIELRLDDERVGELTTATSRHYLPLVQHANDMERTIGVWSKLTGSGLAAELTIHGAKSTEVPDQWLRSMPILPRLVSEARSYEVPPAYSSNSSRNGRNTSTERPTKRPRQESPSVQPSRVPRNPATSESSGHRGSRLVELSDDPGQPFAEVGDIALLSFEGDERNTVRYSVRGKPVTVRDADRKSSPRTMRAGATAALVTSIVLGALLTLIPGIGHVLLVGAIAFGIYVFTHMRRTSEAMQAEADIDVQVRRETGLSLLALGREGRPEGRT
ncbi:HIRAN domain-containing protein [Nesterenkonia sandarakina]|uniref:HIRAN domain-containing protein n=1 Tax=Nesterenkonia sandarakina TaxID=272918 RepID=A0A7Z0E624_9MICC|nr:HIRAN domain-containing protein [Nesterenkonia sandarakina]NYJ15738.1 hypothetical protein [Nesterenkonia sandarakina]